MSGKNEIQQKRMANELGKETSPYLLQHQHNPVYWKAWGKEALELAQQENKLIIVSIGYSTCHWCHVMERESFENEEVAALMNEHFVSIKIDREERPDIDQIYMIAVQLMTNRGGWPLNCICLPDGRPIYGGTYFRSEEWMHLLRQLQHLWAHQPETAYEYATKLAEGIRQSDRLPIQQWQGDFQLDQLLHIVKPWKAQFDQKNGGLQRAPKFPMPTNWDFLLQYGVLTKQADIVEHVHFTLKHLASGGIYDHVGGGFARYAVDERWHVPHFEKMLYDNAQLISLYLAAWQQNPVPQYLRTVKETLAWVEREMLAPNGGFYSALDADSEGVEGKFYTFHVEELAQLTQYGLDEKDIELLTYHFQLTQEGNWEEEGTNVLYPVPNADELAYEQGYMPEEWEEYLAKCKNALLAYRSKRVRPSCDTKQLTAWNAMMLKACSEAYRIVGNEHYLKLAINNAQFIQREIYRADGGLLHQPTDKNRSIPGYLDDYAFTITAFLSLYEATFDQNWLVEAKRLADYTFAHFYNEEEGVFYYTEAGVEALIARKTELLDNVIPSSNSVLFRALEKLGTIYELPQWHTIIDATLRRMLGPMQKYGSAYANWAILLLHRIVGSEEWICSGAQAAEFRSIIDKHYRPTKMVFGGMQSELPLLQGRLSEKTAVFHCKDKTCGLPIFSLNELDEMLKNIH